MNDKIGLSGRVKIVNATTGQVVETPNTIMNIGIAQVAGLITNDVNAGSAFDYLAIGLGSSTLDAAGSGLGSEYLRESGAGVQITTTVTNDTMSLVGSFVADATKTVNEVGIFNESGLDLGSMLARAVFADVNAISGDRINVTYDVAVA